MCSHAAFMHNFENMEKAYFGMTASSQTNSNQSVAGAAQHVHIML